MVPEKRWDCDILQEEGGKRFKSMVEEIKQACAALRGISRNRYPGSRLDGPCGFQGYASADIGTISS